MLEIFHKAGVKAWWYSVCAKGSIPLFKSRILPYHPNAVEPELYRWLVEEAHKRDMVLATNLLMEKRERTMGVLINW